MGRKIVLFSDGTGNSSAKLQKTNVWRLFQSIDQTRAEVLARYDDGVGSSSNRYLAALGGAFGIGLKRNVLDLYKFVCRNHRVGDDIYGFGFSRGAFTMRVLAGLIAKEGLVTFRSESELSRNAAAAYRHYRAKSFPSRSPIVIGLRRLRNSLIWLFNSVAGNAGYSRVRDEMRAARRDDVRIRFLGLWDTVEAYGLPVTELKRGIDWVLWPMTFGDLKLSPKVDRACHALSLDDERTTFHPVHWNETEEAKLVAENPKLAGRLTQVWFAGVHANVGGGYSEDQLALVPLEWIMAEAQAAGLPFAPDCLKRLVAEKSPYARLYNSRAGLASYYRYTPRRIPEWKDARGGTIYPIVHGSVVMRMNAGSDQYAPLPLPANFWVLDPQGRFAPVGAELKDRLDAQPHTKSVPLLGDKTTLQNDTDALKAAVASLSEPNQHALSLVWDTVWWRRFAYAFTVAFTALLAVYPWAAGLLDSLLHGALRSIPVVGVQASDWLKEHIGQIGGSSQGLLAPLVDALSGLIPSWLEPWTKAFIEHPVEFGTIVLMICGGLYASSVLQARIHDRARLAWNDGLLNEYAEWARQDRKTKRAGLLVLAGLVLVAFVVAWVANASTTLLIQLAVIAVVLVLFALYAAADRARFSRMQHVPLLLRGSIALSVARALRTSRIAVGAYRGIFVYALPFAFAFAIIAALAFLANRIAFDAVSATGQFCKPSVADQATEKLGTAPGFATSNMCWPTGLVLKADRRYRIELRTPGDWFDRTSRTDVIGFPADNALHAFATPMKRWWFQNYFKPIARIGEIGNVEYALDAVSPPAAFTYCTSPAENGGMNAAGTAPPATPVASDDAQRNACRTCARAEPKLADPERKVSSPIAPDSAAELLRCSPTPDTRKVLIADITARNTGELFLFVNDAVLMWPGKTDVFYRNNSGTGSATVTVTPVDAAR